MKIINSMFLMIIIFILVSRNQCEDQEPTKTKFSSGVRTVRLTCNSSMVLLANYSCKLKLFSRYISYFSFYIEAKKNVGQLFFEIQVYHKTIMNQNWRSIIRISKIDYCRYIGNPNKTLPGIREYIEDANVKLGSPLKNCPIKIIKIDNKTTDWVYHHDDDIFKPNWSSLPNGLIKFFLRLFNNKDDNILTLIGISEQKIKFSLYEF